MICAISGVVPQDPVVSRRSGYVFERRLIEKHLADTGTCPVTSESLSSEDLLPVKTSQVVKPRPAQATSIPQMLTLFQNEWDAVVLSNYHLEQQLHNARQELSHALYQHDAACRVIARLKKEKEEALAMLAQERQAPLAIEDAVPQAPVSNGKRGPEMELEPAAPAKVARPGITEAMIEEFVACNNKLSASRRKRENPETLAKPEEIAQYTQLSSHPLHKTSKPGIISIDINLEKDWILTGGNDGNAVVFNRPNGEIVATLEGHSKRVTCVKFVAQDNYALTGSADKTVRIWQGKEDGCYDCTHSSREHSGEVRGLAVHPTNKYFVTSSTDKTWALFDIKTGVCVTQVNDSLDLTSAQFHPDGLLLGTGTRDSIVRIWDIKTQEKIADFEGHTGPVTDLCFSENGYFLATAGSDGVKLWDLRKLRSFRSFSPYDAETPTNTVQFDHSGCFIAYAGSDARVHQTGGMKAEWNLLKTFPDLSGSAAITAVRFGGDASYLALGSSNDRNLRIFGAPSSSSASVEEQSDA